MPRDVRGARRARANGLNSAVAIELFHNGFLIHDDLQDDSFTRRGAPTMHRHHGAGIAVNVGNATNLLALGRVMDNHRFLGSTAAGLIAEETELMMRYSLEGQAIELGWIHDNVCSLKPRDYLHMCLKKTSWYSFIHPMRVGAIVAEGRQVPARFCRFGWYVGAAFQIQDDSEPDRGLHAVSQGDRRRSSRRQTHADAHPAAGALHAERAPSA